MTVGCVELTRLTIIDSLADEKSFGHARSRLKNESSEEQSLSKGEKKIIELRRPCPDKRTKKGPLSF